MVSCDSHMTWSHAMSHNMTSCDVHDTTSLMSHDMTSCDLTPHPFPVKQALFMGWQCACCISVSVSGFSTSPENKQQRQHRSTFKGQIQAHHRLLVQCGLWCYQLTWRSVLHVINCEIVVHGNKKVLLQRYSHHGRQTISHWQIKGASKANQPHW